MSPLHRDMSSVAEVTFPMAFALVCDVTVVGRTLQKNGTLWVLRFLQMSTVVVQRQTSSTQGSR